MTDEVIELEDQDEDDEQPEAQDPPDGLGSLFARPTRQQRREAALAEMRRRSGGGAEVGVPQPIDIFAPQTKYALWQRWEGDQSIVPMENEEQARYYLNAWTGWVKANYPDQPNKLPKMLKSVQKWEEVDDEPRAE